MNGKVAVAWLLLTLFGTPLYAQSPCLECLKEAREELKNCLENAISQEDKKSCQEKKEIRAKTCEDGLCKIERTQDDQKREALQDKK